MSLVYVFAASKMEGQPIQHIAGGATGNASGNPPARLRSGPNEFALNVGGMGPEGARAKAADALGLASHQSGSSPAAGPKPDAVLVIGLCGALTDSLSQNGIVAYTDCLSTDSDEPPVQCSPAIVSSIAGLLLSCDINFEKVVGITSPRIAVTKDDRIALAKAGANAVDMESYPILSVAREAGIPAAVLRVVSDTPDTRMPDFNRALNLAGALDGRKALRIALGSPIQTLRLLSGNKHAMGHLAKALEIILPSDCFSAPSV